MSKKKGSLFSKLVSRPKTGRRAEDEDYVDPAVQELLDEVQDDPFDMRLRLKLADKYFSIGDKLKALDQYLTVAENYAEKSFYPKAVAVYKRALEVDPNMIEVYLKLAGQYQKLGLASEVVSMYTKAAELHEAAGRKRQALNTLRMLIDQTPDNAIGRIKLGQRYLNEGFEYEAVEEFVKAGNIFKRKGQPSEQRKLLESLLDKGLEHDKIIGPLLESYAADHQDAKVLNIVAKIKKDVSGSIRIQETIAHSAEELSQYDRAEAALQNVAKMYKAAARQDQIRLVCERIQRFHPDSAFARETLESLPPEILAADLPEATAPTLEEISRMAQPEVVVEIGEEDGSEIEIDFDEEEAAEAAPEDDEAAADVEIEVEDEPVAARPSDSAVDPTVDPTVDP
ncbi:MAG: tetratricopeptide repeat protein, partial [Deltaproteobacteria bacterium]|nr:tetratricopeptide repeat protein [Deltaproteobacteria bacterium]